MAEKLRIKAAHGTFFLVEKDKEIREVRALKIPTALSGHSGGKMFGANNAEGGKEKKDEEGKERPVDKDAIHVVIHVVLAVGSVDSTTSGFLL